VFERFANPYIKHYLLSIALNSVSKFKARVLPSILDYHSQNGTCPPMLTLSFAALLAFYKETEHVSDDGDIMKFFAENWRKVEDGTQNIDALVRSVCVKQQYWGTNLSNLPGFCEEVTTHLKNITTNGMQSTLESMVH